MRVLQQLPAVFAAAVVASAASNVSLGRGTWGGPETWSCNKRCSIDVSQVEKPGCYSRLPDSVNAEDGDKDIVSTWCVCNAPELNDSLQECITSKCPEGSWDYFQGDCSANYIGKPDPDTNGGNALGPVSVVATAATVLALALLSNL